MKSYLTPDMPPCAMAVTQAELGTFVIALHVVPNSLLTGRVGFQFEQLNQDFPKSCLALLAPSVTYQWFSNIWAELDIIVVEDGISFNEIKAQIRFERKSRAFA